jgi:hypothetical protein
MPLDATAPCNIIAPPQLPLKIFIRGESDNYCGTEPRLADLKPAATAAGGWLRFVIPIEGFNCYSLGDMTHIEWQVGSHRPMTQKG